MCSTHIVGDELKQVGVSRGKVGVCLLLRPILTQIRLAALIAAPTACASVCADILRVLPRAQTIEEAGSGRRFVPHSCQ